MCPQNTSLCWLGYRTSVGPRPRPHPSSNLEPFVLTSFTLVLLFWQDGGRNNSLSRSLELTANLTDCLFPKELESVLKFVLLFNALTSINNKKCQIYIRFYRDFVSLVKAYPRYCHGFIFFFNKASKSFFFLYAVLLAVCIGPQEILWWWCFLKELSFYPSFMRVHSLFHSLWE